MGSTASVRDLTLLTPYGYSASSCGYCSPRGSRSSKDSSVKYGMQSPKMTCQFYQDLIDRGWRRSGDYLYHPDNGRTCCPQYTIRLDSSASKPCKKHRQVINRFNRYLSQGLKPGEERTNGDVHIRNGDSSSSGAAGRVGQQATQNGKGKGTGKGKGKGKGTGGNGFASDLRAFELYHGVQGMHRFETQLVPAKATPETFALYKKYQVAVHKDKPEAVTTKGFSRFLCDSPLIEAAVVYRKGAHTDRLPKSYGSYHLLYRVDGQLVGISVIDILPSCISSVYFIWDPDWAWASLGKWSAMREIVLARDMRGAGAEGIKWVYMGYWIANCVKMRYKSEYSPSFLLDPGTHIFYPLTDALDKRLQTGKGYRPFGDINDPPPPDPISAPEGNSGSEADSDSEEEYERQVSFPSPAPLGFTEPREVDEELLDNLLVVMRGRAIRNADVPWVHPTSMKDIIRELVAAVGANKLGCAGMALEELRERALITF